MSSVSYYLILNRIPHVPNIEEIDNVIGIPQLDRNTPDVSGLGDEEALQRITDHKASLESHLAAIRPLIELINEREALYAEKADFEEVATSHVLFDLFSSRSRSHSRYLVLACFRSLWVFRSRVLLTLALMRLDSILRLVFV